MRASIKSSIWRLLDTASRGFSKLGKVVRDFGTYFEPDDLQRQRIKVSTRYNMVTSPDEPYYAQQYWHILFPHLQGLPCSAICLDLGCSQGRFTLRLARHFYEGRVTACDISEEALKSAISYAHDQGVNNVEFRHQSIRDCLSSYSDRSFVDVILMTEVTFFYPEWYGDLPRIIHLLKPGGVLAISFRSQYFDALCLARNRLWENTDMLLTKRQGRVLGGTMEFTWQRSEEIRELFLHKSRVKTPQPFWNRLLFGYSW